MVLTTRLYSECLWHKTELVWGHGGVAIVRTEKMWVRLPRGDPQRRGCGVQGPTLIAMGR